MTGMGADGTEGIGKLRTSRKTYVIAQDQETSIVFGMPKSIIAAGLADQVVPSQINLDSVLDSIEHTPIHSDNDCNPWWMDVRTVNALANEPSLIPLINEHMSNGVFDIVAQEMMKQIWRMSVFQIYKHMNRSGSLAKGAFGV